MKKRVFIIHGWGGRPDEAWIPWLRQEMEARGYEVTAPMMPENQMPDIEKWKLRLARLVDKADKNTYFVGHSIGCQAILRYLEYKEQKIGGAVFVAGWFVLENLDKEDAIIAEPWLKTPIDLEKVKRTTENFTLVISENDPYEGFEENKRVFSEKLGAKIVIKKEGHFTEGDRVFKLPIVLEELIRFAK